MNKYEINELYSDFDYVDHSRAAHRQRPRPKKKKRKKQNGRTSQIMADIRKMDDSHESWVPSYAAALDPLHHERHWVIASVAPFYHDALITDVTRLVKGGKEANVYVCAANPATGFDLVAAKLYRERMLRHLKNDAIYKVGRTLRDADGKQIKSRRERTAVLKKSGYGQHLDFMMWVGTEYRVQTELYDAGADVPKPIAQSGASILMEFIGDEYGPAPTLNEISLEPDEARPLFQRVMNNVKLMLDHHLIHGDLSAYNILYWEGDIILIDFPQMVQARQNPHAYDLLLRDVTRVCDYFNRFGTNANPQTITDDLWLPYMGSKR
ncbi:MAG: hypothetical protein GY803_14985 [Chloroflexi bacterium]|nr:hypothetical protein [Chloroflexota bacterium]